MKTNCQIILALMFTSPLLAHAEPYQEPSGDSTATIEFFNDSSKNMSIGIYGDAKECTDRKVTFAKEGARKKLVVVAGQDFAFNVATDPKGAGIIFAFGGLGAVLGADVFKGCRPTIVFHPEPGHNYFMQMSSDGSDCAYKFYEKPAADSAKPDEQIHVAFESREFNRAWGESGPWCKKKIVEESKETSTQQQ